MKKYQVSRFFKFTVLLAATGLFLLILFVVALLRYSFPKKVSEFELGILRNGQYVQLEFQELYPGNAAGNGNVESVYLGLSKDYNLYRLRVGKQGMIKALIHDENSIRQIEAWPDGKGAQSLSLIFEVSREASDLMLVQKTGEDVRTTFGLLSFLGGVFLLVAVALFLTVGGFQVVYDRPFEDSKRYKDIFLGKNYRMEEELAHEKAALENYRLKQQEMKKTFRVGLAGLLGFLLGILFCGLMIRSLFSTGNIVAFALGVILGLVCFYGALFCINLLWTAYVNSDSPNAKKLSEKFLLRTLSVKKEESSKLINLLTRKIREAEQKARENGEDNVRMWYGPGVWEEKEGESESESNTTE